MPAREQQIHTKDDVPLVEVAENAEQIVDYFNNEADVPFVDVFVEEMDQQTFIQEIDDTRPDEFEPLAEGEFPGFQNDTSKPDYNELTIRAQEYGKSLGMTQRYIENATSDQLQDKIEEVVDGATETMMDTVFDVIFDSTYDGSGDLWFQIPDYGSYTFDDTHSHVIPDTTTLMGDVGMPDEGGDGYTAQEHFEAAAEHLRHHGWTNGQKVALVSKDWKFKLKQELTYDADYHIPMAENLRNTSIREMGPTPGGVTIMQSPYLTGDEFLMYDTGIQPVKMYTERELQLTQPQGGPVQMPGDIINGSATMSFGVACTNPLAMVEFSGVDVDWETVATRY